MHMQQADVSNVSGNERGVLVGGMHPHARARAQGGMIGDGGGLIGLHDSRPNKQATELREMPSNNI